MMLLENGLVYSPGNHQLKILLIKTYLEAGLAEAADCIFSQLECKHIQLDSLGYLHCTLLAPLGYLSQAASAFEHVSKFFITNYKDVCFKFLIHKNLLQFKLHKLITKFLNLEYRSLDICL